MKKRKGTEPARVAEILRRLKKAYPNVQCALTHRNAWELTVATILSAQCTDVRVNKVTPGLFAKYPSPTDFANATQLELEQDIRSTGFYRNKAKSILGAAKTLLASFKGVVPKTMDEILTLPGVARKTGNVVLGVWYKIASGVVVDTHVYRIARRLDLTKQETPEKIERDLMEILPQKEWIDFSHRVIWHGRGVCLARKPKCRECNLEDICYAKDKNL